MAHCVLSGMVLQGQVSLRAPRPGRGRGLPRGPLGCEGVGRRGEEEPEGAVCRRCWPRCSGR
eukprot:11083239-Lingulodinium_polyedra.AAC.1